MDKKYRTEWLVNLVKGKEGNPDFENERILKTSHKIMKSEEKYLQNFII